MPTSEPGGKLPVVVTAEWLAERQARDSVRVADVRWYLDGRSGRAAYLAGHLPGAVFVDVDRDLAASATPSAGRHPLPDPAEFARRMGELGIGDRTTVVAYDDAGGSTAARLVWLLRVIGSPAALLDGGIQSWPGPLETGEVTPSPESRSPVAWPAHRIASAEEVLAATRDSRHLLLDARVHARFSGEAPAPVDPRPGHVPGARSAPWQGNLDSDGRFASPERLRSRFAALGATETTSIVAYCGSGVTACHDLLALEHAGYERTRLFPGSWSAWGADPTLPAETGPDE